MVSKICSVIWHHWPQRIQLLRNSICEKVFIHVLIYQPLIVYQRQFVNQDGSTFHLTDATTFFKKDSSGKMRRTDVKRSVVTLLRGKRGKSMMPWRRTWRLISVIPILKFNTKLSITTIKLANTIASDAMDPCITKQSTIIVFPLKDKCIIVLHREDFKW